MAGKVPGGKVNLIFERGKESSCEVGHTVYSHPLMGQGEMVDTRKTGEKQTPRPGYLLGMLAPTLFYYFLAGIVLNSPLLAVCYL